MKKLVSILLLAAITLSIDITAFSQENDAEHIYNDYTACVSYDAKASYCTTKDVTVNAPRLTDGSYSIYQDMYNTKYIDIDLGRVFEIKGLKATLQFGDDVSYEIYGKKEYDNDFEKLGEFSYRNSVNSRKPIAVEFGLSRCRYVRLVPPENTHSVIIEVEVLGIVKYNDFNVNIAGNADIDGTASYERYPKTNMFDGIIGPIGYVTADTEESDPNASNNKILIWTVDLQKAYTIGAFNWYYGANWDDGGCYLISGSADGEHYTKLGTFSYDNNAGEGETGMMYFEEISCRYIRITATSGSVVTNKKIRCREFEIYGFVSAVLGDGGYTVPFSNQTGVTNTGDKKTENVEVHFANEMNEQTLTPDNITVCDEDENSVEITDFTANINTFSFPLSLLKSNKKYVVTIGENIQKSDGVPTGIRYSFEFETGFVFKGYISSEELIFETYPENNSTDITNADVNMLSIKFSREMDVSTLNPSNIKLFKNGEEAVYDAYEATNTEYTVDMGLLDSDSTYEAVVSEKVMTADGYAMSEEYRFSFSTEKILKSYSLTQIISETYPKDNAKNVTNIEQSGLFKICFGMDIESESILDAVEFKEVGKTINPVYTASENMYRADLAQLKSDTEYTVIVRADKLKLKSGDRVIGSNFEFSFSTGRIIDIPAVEGMVISNVAKNRRIIYSGKVTNERPVSNMNDGDVKTAAQVAQNKEAVIDLGIYYDIRRIVYSPATSFDYSGSGLDYHITGVQILQGKSCTKEGELDTVYTTVKIGKGEPNTVSALPSDNFVRYIGVKTPQILTIVGELEAFAYVDKAFVIEDNEGKIKICSSNFTDKPETYTLIISEYGEDGRLKAFGSEQLKAAANEVKTVEREIAPSSENTVTTDAALIKSFAGFKYFVSAGNKDVDTKLTEITEFIPNDNGFELFVNEENKKLLGDYDTFGILVLKPGCTFKEVDISDSDVYYIKRLTKKELNEGGLKINIPVTDDFGKYMVKMSVSGITGGYDECCYTYMHVSPEDRQTVCKEFSVCTPQNMINVWNTYKDIAFDTDGLDNLDEYLPFISEIFCDLRENVYGINESKIFSSVNEVTDCIKKSVSMYALQTLDRESAQNVFSSYGFLYADILNTANKDNFNSLYLLYNDIKSSGKVINSGDIKRVCAMANMQSASKLRTVGEIAECIKTYHDVIGADLSYAKLKNAEINAVAAKVNSSAVSVYYNDANWFVKLVDAVCIQGDDSGGKTHGGGGGGGAGGGAVTIPVNDASGEKKTDENETAGQKTAFHDMQGFEWAYDAVNYLHDKGILSGDGSGNFMPDNSVTRDEFVKMICMAFNIEINPRNDVSFSDVDTKSWYYPYVQIAASNRIVNGHDDNSFGVGEPITRQDIASILLNVMTYKNISIIPNKCSFYDRSDVSDYAKTAVDTMTQIKVISGFEDESFRPMQKAGRAEAAVMIYRLINYFK